jgi:hypothetical protein
MILLVVVDCDNIIRANKFTVLQGCNRLLARVPAGIGY